MNPSGAKTVLITVPDETVAGTVARTLVEQRLAAGVNIIPGLTSIYHWRGKIEEASELLLLAITSEERFAELEEAVKAMHPYETPEIIALPITLGSSEYLSWVHKETKTSEK